MRPRDTARLLGNKLLKSDRFCSGFVEFDKKKAFNPLFEKVGYFPPFEYEKELLVNNPPNVVV